MQYELDISNAGKGLVMRIETKIGIIEAANLRVLRKEVLEILGIPYATSDGRFTRSQLIEKYTKDPINCGYGVRFPQRDVPPLLNRFLKNPMMRPEILTNSDQMSEDAFVLNIWTESLTGKRPVLVYIHGGGFTYGSGTTPLYNGKYLAAKGIVVVTINYRLGIPGFLPIQTEEGINANRGFYDQQCALQWIRKNINHFGGDFENITLAGQSAGGMSAFTHMLNEKSEKYFDKLMVFSAGAPKCVSAESAKRAGQAFLEQHKIKDIKTLDLMSMKKIAKLPLPLGVGSSPVIDGELFCKQASELLLSGEYTSKPVIISSTDDELKMVDNKSWHKSLGIVSTEEALEKKAKNTYGEDGIRLLIELKSEARSIQDQQFKLIELVMFHSSVLRALEAFSKKCTAYGMRIGYIPNAWNGLRGAYHCAELPFLFGTIRDMDYPVTEQALLESDQLQDDVISFLRCGEIEGKASYTEQNKILRYRNGSVEMTEFPERKIIMETWDTDLYDVIRKDFMRGRDDNFIA